MTYTEVHANFCEQQITVLVLSDTVDTRLEKVCPSLPTMSRSSSIYNIYIYIYIYIVTAEHHQGVA